MVFERKKFNIICQLNRGFSCNFPNFWTATKIEENKIILDFHIFDDVSENNEEYELELGKYFFEDKFFTFYHLSS